LSAETQQILTLLWLKLSEKGFMVMTFYELNVGASQTEMKRNLLGCNLHKIANKYLPPYVRICVGIVIVIAWPKAFRNKLSGIWSLDFPCS